MRILIKNGTLVNEGTRRKGDIIIENDIIKEIITEEGSAMTDGSTSSCLSADDSAFDEVIDAQDCLVLPGVIDTHVHFREPGLTHKADMESESRAAIYGGVTSVFEMPNTKPQTTTAEAMEEKLQIAKEKMHVNYAFFPGATNDNLDYLSQLNPHEVPGIKLFMGSSTGNMLVDQEDALDGVFRLAKEKEFVVMTHCEDTETINHNMQMAKDASQTDDPAIENHCKIRSAEACYKSSSLAASMAKKHGTRLHIAHLTTKEEIGLLGGNITGEVTPAHMVFNADDYSIKGALIKCNPAVKEADHQEALRKAFLVSDLPALCTIGTDHAPHAIEEKQGRCAKAMSGMPSIQFSLPMMLTLADSIGTTAERLVSLMAHNPAKLFGVSKRGFLREGYKADIVIVKRNAEPTTITKDIIQSKCGWSPFEGMKLSWSVQQTIVNGHLIYNKGLFDGNVKGEKLVFNS